IFTSGAMPSEGREFYRFRPERLCRKERERMVFSRSARNPITEKARFLPGSGLLLLLLGGLAGAGSGWGAAAVRADGEGLAARYRQDEGIGKDPAVIFSEDFEKASVAEVSAKWSQTYNGAGMTLEKDVPAAAAAESRSLRM